MPKISEHTGAEERRRTFILGYCTKILEIVCFSANVRFCFLSKSNDGLCLHYTRNTMFSSTVISIFNSNGVPVAEANLQYSFSTNKNKASLAQLEV